MSRVTFSTGKILGPGEKSQSGLYAIQSLRNGMTLRISLFQEAAELMRDDSRQIVECWLMEE